MKIGNFGVKVNDAIEEEVMIEIKRFNEDKISDTFGNIKKQVK